METVDNNTIRYNEYNQPIGFVVKDSNKRDRPSDSILKGCYCDLERVNPDRHLDDLYEEVYGPTCNKSNFTYMSIEPFVTKDSLYEYLLQISSSQDPMHYAIIDKESGKALGTMSLMRIDENNGVIEIGNIMYSDKLKHTRIATEVQYLFISYVFDELGYRRYEWKCDSLNEPSRKAALRLGFTFESIFRNAIIYKNRNRDTAWFSIIDTEWSEINRKYISWLSPSNFDELGKQNKSLKEC